MAKITKSIDIADVPQDRVEYADFSKQGSLYVSLSEESELYLVKVNGEKVKEEIDVDQKALDSSGANDKLDQLLSDASGGSED
ncbi:hypothetical protein [Natronococcus roseus]|uniref:hypothetical protein n=1 Tax=Natronococcus roseus TaxID=1052014 RepID=UPI00374CE0F9